MMTDNDRNCANDDDTESFEALESRMRTPYKQKSSALARLEDKENTPANVSGVEPINDTIVSGDTAADDVISVTPEVVRHLPVPECPRVADTGAEEVQEDEEEPRDEEAAVGEEAEDEEEAVSGLCRSVSQCDLATSAQVTSLPLARSCSHDNVSAASVRQMSPLVRTLIELVISVM